MERRVLLASTLQSPLLALVLLLGPAGCHDHTSHAGTTEPPHAPQRWTQLAFVRAARAAPHFSEWFPARVAIDDARAARIGPPIAGRVTHVWVERGQRVATGDRLFAIASGDLAELEAAHAKAAVELATARSSLARTQALVAASSLPAKELRVAEQAVAEAELAARTAAIRISSLHMTGGTVLAPRAGTVVELPIATGQQVSPSDAATIAIADLSEVWVVGDVLDGELGNLRAGTAAEVRIGDGVIATTVDEVGAVVDPERHTIRVRVRLPNAAGAVRPNLHAELRILDDDDDLAVPDGAVETDGAHAYVYVRTGERVRRREVIAGPAQNGVRSIHHGLAEGDEIVARGMALLDNQLDPEVAK